MTRINIGFDDPLLAAIRQEAKDTGLSLSAVIRSWLLEYLEIKRKEYDKTINNRN